jgi:hypothetical protein
MLPLHVLLLHMLPPTGRDEYNRSADHWMPQLYIRSALRMVGKRVLTEQDVVSTTSFRRDEEVIGLGSYTVDVPGAVQRVVVKGEVVDEGGLKVPFFCDPKLASDFFCSPLARIMLPVDCGRGEHSYLYLHYRQVFPDRKLLKMSCSFTSKNIEKRSFDFCVAVLLNPSASFLPN